MFASWACLDPGSSDILHLPLAGLRQAAAPPLLHLRLMARSLGKPTWCMAPCCCCTDLPYACYMLYPTGVVGCRTTFDVAFTFEERVMEQLVEGILSVCRSPPFSLIPTSQREAWFDLELLLAEWHTLWLLSTPLGCVLLHLTVLQLHSHTIMPLAVQVCICCAK